MSDVLDRIEEKGYQQGRMKAAIEIAEKMIQSDYDPETVASITELPIEKVEELVGRNTDV